jgi:hypothetical protein
MGTLALSDEDPGGKCTSAFTGSTARKKKKIVDVVRPVWRPARRTWDLGDLDDPQSPVSRDGLQNRIWLGELLHTTEGHLSSPVR